MRSARVDGKVKQLTLLNLDRFFELDQTHWPALCVCFEVSLSGQPAADGVVPASSPVGDVQAVNVDSLELVRPRTVGVEIAGLWAMAQVDFVGLLGEWGFTGPKRTAALGSIIGRMAAPGSELSTYAWLREQGYRYLVVSREHQPFG
jgi:hypothetical protein